MDKMSDIGENDSININIEYDYKFEGWMGLDASSAEGNMIWKDFEPKPWEENDVDIRVTHSGICGTDIHTLRAGWVSTHNMLMLRCRTLLTCTGPN